jgi:hypothetical protein
MPSSGRPCAVRDPSRRRRRLSCGPRADVLRLRVFGGYYNQEPQHALISFLCDEAAQEPTGLEYSHAYNGSHWMTWRTPHACPTHVDPAAAHAPHHPGEDDDERGEVPPEDTFVPDARARNIWAHASWLGAACVPRLFSRRRSRADAAPAVRWSSPCSCSRRRAGCPR